MEKIKDLFKQAIGHPINSLKLLIVIFAPILMCLFSGSAIMLIIFIFSMILINFTTMNKLLKAIILVIDLLPVVIMISGTNNYYVDVLTLAGIYSILALGLNIVVGFTGMFNLGYVAFYLVGAYVYGIASSPQVTNFLNASFLPFSGNWFWLFLIIGGLAAAGLGFLLSLPVRRLKGDYLAIVSLGFAEILRLLANNLDKPVNITNGPKGISPIQSPELFGLSLSKPIDFYIIVLILFVIALVVTMRLNNSRIGRSWTSIREDELAAKTMGISVVKMKMLAFVIGTSFAGVMGVVFAAKQSYIDPSSFQFLESISLLTMVILGGFGSIPGVVIGALILSTLQIFVLKQFSLVLGALTTAGLINIPSQLDPAKYEKLIYGILLIVICIFRPQGLLPAKRSTQYLENYSLNRSGLAGFFKRDRDLTLIKK